MADERAWVAAGRAVLWAPRTVGVVVGVATAEPMMATARQLVDQAQTYAGLPYRLGAEAALHADVMPAALDCSELVELSCARVGVFIPDGTVNQFPWCRHHDTLIGVDEAVWTVGALLFVWAGPGGGDGGGNHVAISRGDGTTIEARSTRYGVGNFPTQGRGWTHGAYVPGITYAIPAPTLEDTVFGLIHYPTMRTGTADTWDFHYLPANGSTVGKDRASVFVTIRQAPNVARPVEASVFFDGRPAGTLEVPGDGRTVTISVEGDGLCSIIAPGCAVQAREFWYQP